MSITEPNDNGNPLDPKAIEARRKAAEEKADTGSNLPDFSNPLAAEDAPSIGEVLSAKMTNVERCETLSSMYFAESMLKQVTSEGEGRKKHHTLHFTEQGAVPLGPVGDWDTLRKFKNILKTHGIFDCLVNSKSLDLASTFLMQSADHAAGVIPSDDADIIEMMFNVMTPEFAKNQSGAVDFWADSQSMADSPVDAHSGHFRYIAKYVVLADGRIVARTGDVAMAIRQSQVATPSQDEIRRAWHHTGWEMDRFSSRKTVKDYPVFTIQAAKLGPEYVEMVETYKASLEEFLND